MATLPAYLNAISGKGVHVITVNDYLASRDAEWMGRLHRFLGLTVGVNLSQMDHDTKQAAYAADITYGTNNEFGFDYLRDNMVYSAGDRVQRKLNYAIVDDEVDSILIDEARTPPDHFGSGRGSYRPLPADEGRRAQAFRAETEEGEAITGWTRRAIRFTCRKPVTSAPSSCWPSMDCWPRAAASTKRPTSPSCTISTPRCVWL